MFVQLSPAQDLEFCTGRRNEIEKLIELSRTVNLRSVKNRDRRLELHIRAPSPWIQSDFPFPFSSQRLITHILVTKPLLPPFLFPLCYSPPTHPPTHTHTHYPSCKSSFEQRTLSQTPCVIKSSEIVGLRPSV